MTRIRLENLSKIYRKNTPKILDSINLQIGEGELFFLLGPSGCGKSTLLRIVAGLIEPSEGKIFFGDDDVTALPTEKRQTAMVFQNYALWPHMTVLQNLTFGLQIRKIPSSEAEKLAMETLKIVGMTDYAARKPGELSGGQQQRVALARAIVVRPRVLLLDEPLSNLDAKLRISMRNEIRTLCKSTGLTTIYVTHDQKEALAIADRMAVLHNGILQQIGSPREIYRDPANSFVAEFIGEGNFFKCRITGQDGSLFLTESYLGALKGRASVNSAKFAAGSELTALIRPESIKVKTEKGENSFPAKFAGGVFLGELAQWSFVRNDQLITVFEQNPPERREGEQYFLHVEPENLILLNS